MNKNIIGFLLFSVSFAVYASDGKSKEEIVSFSSDSSQEGSPFGNYYYTQDSESDVTSSDQNSSGFGGVIIVPRRSSSQEEMREGNIVFNKFYHLLAETKDEDDIHTDYICVNALLFPQLLLQAFKTLHNSTLSQQPFQELLQRLNEGIIAKNYNTRCLQEQYLMTAKDLKHRLLSYIPMGKKKCLVNDKVVTLRFCGYQTDEDFDDYFNSMRQFKGQEKEDDYYGTQSLCFVGKRTGKELRAYGHDFESNKEHHQEVIKEFELLLKK